MSYLVIVQDGEFLTFAEASNSEGLKLFKYFRSKDLATVYVKDGTIVEKYVSPGYEQAFLKAINELLRSLGPQPTNRWQFDEPNGVAIDSIGGVNGVLNNATRVKPGHSSDSSVQISGNDSYVNFGKGVGQFGTGNFSIAYWLNTTETRFCDSIGNRICYSNGNFVWIALNHPTLGAGTVLASVNQDAGGTNIIGVNSRPVLINDGQWHHITFVRNGQSASLYVDGNILNSVSAAGVANINNGNDFRLGLNSSDAGYGGNVRYDDLQVFNIPVVPTVEGGRVTFRRG